MTSRRDSVALLNAVIDLRATLMELCVALNAIDETLRRDIPMLGIAHLVRKLETEFDPR